MSLIDSQELPWAKRVHASVMLKVTVKQSLYVTPIFYRLATQKVASKNVDLNCITFEKIYGNFDAKWKHQKQTKYQLVTGSMIVL